MHPLGMIGGEGRSRRLLFLGAHSDDIEIGCGGTVLSLAEEEHDLEILWVVMCATARREREARDSAALFLGGLDSRVEIAGFKDGYLPEQWAEVKRFIETVREGFEPDVVFTHFREDRHQDHRTVSDLTWNTFRDHLVLEYEIPKYDADLGHPNVYVPLDRDVCARKARYLMSAFASQREKSWFSEETFGGLMKLRGNECRAPEGYAEAFHGRKLCLDLAPRGGREERFGSAPAGAGMTRHVETSP